MFNFGSPSLKTKTASYGGGVKPYTMPTQGQMGNVSGFKAPTGGGMDPMMLMAMMGGMGGQKGGGAQMINDTADYQGGSGLPLPVQQTQQNPYQMAVMKALMGGMGV